MHSLKFTAARLQWEPSGSVLCVALTPDSRHAAEALVNDVSTHSGKVYDLDAKQHRERRSLDANAYFHVLVGKIAEEAKRGFKEVKTELVLEYGATARDEDGQVVGFKLPANVDVSTIYRYSRWFDTRIENGIKFNCYIAYKHTSNLDTQEMSTLIDGAIYAAQELGIETATPEEVAKMKSLWGA